MSYGPLGVEPLGSAQSRDRADVFFVAKNLTVQPPAFTPHNPLGNRLDALSLTVGSPVIGHPAFTQVLQIYNFTARNLTVGPPDVGNASRRASTFPLGEDPLGSGFGTETVRTGFPALNQNQQLPSPRNVIVGSPVFGHPTLTSVIGAFNLTVGSPVIGKPALGVIDLNAFGAYDLIGQVSPVADFVGQWDISTDVNVTDLIGVPTGILDIQAAIKEHAMPASHPLIEEFSGDNWYLRFTNFKTDGTPLDLTSCVIAWTLYNDRGVAVVTLTTAAGVTIVDAPNGVCLVIVPPAQSGVPNGKYRDKLVVTTPLGVVETTCVGDISVRNK